jgi:ATP/maltotriose-dependent transcriptional regulator MalT
MLWSGAVEEAVELLVAEADRVSQQAPEQGAAMLADAAAACTAARGNRHALVLVERAVALLPGVAAEARAHVLAIHGYVLVLRGQMRRALPVLAEAARLGADVDELAPAAQWKHLLLRMRIPADELEGARVESLRLCERARGAGALAALGGALVVTADAAWRLGDWDAADAAAVEAIRVAEDTGHDVWRGLALGVRARLTAARGEAEECRLTAMQALALAQASGMISGRRYAHGALGFLELGLGRVDAAIAQLETVERVSAQLGVEEPTTVPWAADLVEAYARAGRDADARRVCATLARQVQSSGSTSAAAALARCRGLLSDDFDSAFADALALDVRCPQPFERARTLLCFGQRQRRAGRRAEARERLREARAAFARLGAAAWEAQAAHELRAAGGRRHGARSAALTPQERRVVAAVQRGASNREIAAELFLAEKTIEFHLHQVFGKLGVRSRTQLVAHIARQGFP